MTDAELQRYARHVLLDEIGIAGQHALLAARVVIVGAGGLGCAAALYLAAAGVGELHVVDDDVVELTNLQRQIAHSTANIGHTKVASLQAACLRINPHIAVHTHAVRASADNLPPLLANASAVLDCTDNFQTRQLINAASVAHGTPLISGSAVGLDAQLSVFTPKKAASPCYACVFAPRPAGAESVDLSCATMGVLAPLVGVVGSMQATQTLALIAGFGQLLVGELLMLDARDLSQSRMRINRNPDCPVCAHRPG